MVLQFTVHGDPDRSFADKCRQDYFELNETLRDAFANRRFRFGVAKEARDYNFGFACGPFVPTAISQFPAFARTEPKFDPRSPSCEMEIPAPDRQTSLFYDFTRGHTQGIILNAPQITRRSRREIAPPRIAFHAMIGKAVAMAFGDLHLKHGFNIAQARDSQLEMQGGKVDQPRLLGNFAEIWAAQALSERKPSDFAETVCARAPASWAWVKANVPSARHGLNFSGAALNTPDANGETPLMNLLLPSFDKQFANMAVGAFPVSHSSREFGRLLRAGGNVFIRHPAFGDSFDDFAHNTIFDALMDRKLTTAVRTVIDYHANTRPWESPITGALRHRVGDYIMAEFPEAHRGPYLEKIVRFRDGSPLMGLPSPHRFDALRI